jgi:hypothetical protein
VKKFLLLAVLCLILLTGCVQDTRDVDSIQVVRFIYESDGVSLVPEVLKTWTFIDEDDTDTFMDALRKKTKADEQIDMRPRDYLIQIFYSDGKNQEYDLWLNEDIQDRGVLMQGDDTWTIQEESHEALETMLR